MIDYYFWNFLPEIFYYLVIFQKCYNSIVKIILVQDDFKQKIRCNYLQRIRRIKLEKVLEMSPLLWHSVYIITAVGIR